MRTLVSGLVAAAAITCPNIASADHVYGSRSDKLVEEAHWISLKIDRGHAEAVVRRTVWNGGSRHDQATWWLDLPDGAVAIDLRTLSEKDGRPIWYRAELMEAEAAAAKYKELTGIGGYYPKDPALLSWRRQGFLALQVFPVPPSQPKTIEYTLSLPTHYERGRHRVTLPPMGTEKLPARVEITPAISGDRVFVNGKAATAGSGFTLHRETEISLALAPAGAPTLEGALASVPLGPSRVLSHFRIAAAPRLSEMPKGAHVVVIVDGSRSFDAGQRASGIAAARGMLSHLPDARVEVLSFDREVRAHLGGFTPASRASAALAKLAIAPRNGSRVDDAIARADALLAGAPSRAPKRIVLVTDLLTRSELTPERARPLLKSGAILHIGVVESFGATMLTRNDDHPWSPVARATGGLLWEASASDDAKAAAEVYEEWARPMRLHAFKIDAKGLGDALSGVPPELAEGEGFEDFRVGDHDVTEVAIEGELWSTPARRALHPEEIEARRWSALAFGDTRVFHALHEPEMMALATRGHAVSPVTSLLAIEPGVRPSTEGLEEPGVGEGGGARGEGIGLGSIGTIGHGGGGFDPFRFLREALRKGLDACGGHGRSASVTLETTRDEIVDVPAVAIRGGSDAKMDACLREAAWSIDLPSEFSASFQGWSVSF